MTGSPDISLHIGISQIVNPSLWTVVLNFPHRPQAKLKIMFLLGGPKNSFGLFWGLFNEFLNKLTFISSGAFFFASNRTWNSYF